MFKLCASFEVSCQLLSAAADAEAAADDDIGTECGTPSGLINERGFNSAAPMSQSFFSARCVRRSALALLTIFVVCHVRSNDGTRAQMERVSQKSLQAGKTLRITRAEETGKSRCLKCQVKAQNSSQLPSPNQAWSHATNSRQQLQRAMQDPTVTAIEADMLMGVDKMHGPNSTLQAIMGHPVLGRPVRSSDLSFETFMDMCTSPGADRSRVLQKHIKLDFKEQAVLEPAFTALSRLRINPNGKTIFLNADILPQANARIEANDFLATCYRLIHNLEQTSVSYHSARCNNVNRASS